MIAVSVIHSVDAGKICDTDKEVVNEKEKVMPDNQTVALVKNGDIPEGACLTQGSKTISVKFSILVRNL